MQLSLKHNQLLIFYLYHMEPLKVHRYCNHCFVRYAITEYVIPQFHITFCMLNEDYAVYTVRATRS